MRAFTCIECGSTGQQGGGGGRPRKWCDACRAERKRAAAQSKYARDEARRAQANRKRGTCATCNRPIHQSSTSLPQGVAQCRDCRRVPPAHCTDCGCVVSNGSIRCRSCHVVHLDGTSKSGQRRHLGIGRRVVINGVEFTDPRQTRSWRLLRDQVVYEEPLCALGLGGCAGWSETADHVITVAERPDLAMVRSNLRGTCESCNMRRPRLRGSRVA